MANDYDYDQYAYDESLGGSNFYESDPEAERYYNRSGSTVAWIPNEDGEGGTYYKNWVDATAEHPGYGVPEETNYNSNKHAKNAYAGNLQKELEKSLAEYKAALDSAKSSAITGVKSQTQASIDKLTSQQTDINLAADKSSQQAYVSRELARRDMPQQLAAKGRTGGASESALLGLNTSYENNRNEISTNRNKSINDNNLQQSGVRADEAKAIADLEAQYSTMYANATLQNAQTIASLKQQLALQQMQNEKNNSK